MVKHETETARLHQYEAERFGRAAVEWVFMGRGAIKAGFYGPTPESCEREARRLAVAAASSGRQYLAMTRPHSQDEDCILNPDTYVCYFCDVEHGSPCQLCGGRGYHRPSCLELERELPS